MIETELRTYLLSKSGITNIVGQRIFALRPPGRQVSGQSAEYPCLAYTRISGPRVRTIGGPVGTAHPVFQLDGWASSYAEVLSLMDQVRLALDGYKLSVHGAFGAASVHTCWMEEDEEDDFDKDTKLYRRSAPYKIWHEE